MKTKTQPTNIGYIVIYNQIKQTRKEYLKKNNFISKKSWYFLTKSEMKVINKNKIAKPIGKAKFMESIVQHKLNKWIRKNPKPCDEMNLFKDEFLSQWKEEKDKTLEHFRDVVISTYDKTVLPFNSKKSELVFIVKNTYSGQYYKYPNMDPAYIGYPLCKFTGKRFVKKGCIVDACKEALKMASKSGFNCKSVDYTYENKVLLNIAA
jgi:hypothetical protein